MTQPLNAGGTGSIPAWGTKTPHAAWNGQKKQKWPKGGRRAFLHLLLNPPNTVMFLIKEGCGCFQEGTQQYVWGDVVLLYYSHFSIPTRLLRPFEDIEMGLAMVMD